MSRSYNNRASYSRGFESDATAEELFNMFFGGGFSNANVFVRRNGRVYRQTASSGETHHTPREVTIQLLENIEKNFQRFFIFQTQTSGFAAFFQLLPILLAILLSMASSLFISDPAYSLQPTS